MGIIISELLHKANISDDVKILREKPFDFFARATTIVKGTKCVFVTAEKYIKNLDTSVTMVIINDDLADKVPKDKGVCTTENPRGLFFELMSYYDKNIGREGKETTIGSNCIISSTAIISPIDVTIGNNVNIGDYVVIQPGTVIGDNVTIQTGAKIGEQDFNVYQFRGITKQVYHGGRVTIGSNVLISSGVLIGQALYSYGLTNVGDNCFIGADTCIGHNSCINDNCEICGNSMIGGYCNIGKECKIFMSVTIANATNVGNNVTINMGSVVVRDVGDGKVLFGNPAREIIAPK